MNLVFWISGLTGIFVCCKDTERFLHVFLIIFSQPGRVAKALALTCKMLTEAFMGHIIQFF